MNRLFNRWMQTLVVTCCMLMAIRPALAQTQVLSGKVTIAGTDNSALATIRIVDQGIGTTSKLDGTYYLEDIKPGLHTVEYSFIGHRTVTEQISWQKGEAKTKDVMMEEAPIVLSAAFVTPNGEDAAQYILNHVWKHAEQARVTMPAFDGKASTVISYTDFDIFHFLPSPLRITLMTMMAMLGVKKIVKLLVDHSGMNATILSDMHYRKKDYTWDHFAITRCNEQLTDDEKKTLYKLAEGDDLYDTVYGSNNKFHSKKTKAVLKGSYEEGDRMVYILDGTNKKERYEMHVVEDTWDVLRLYQHDEVEDLQVECRKGPGGLYLPISVNRKITLMEEQSIEELKKDADQPLTDKERKKQEKRVNKMKNDPKKMEHALAIKERTKDRGLSLVLNYGMSISY